MRNFIIVLAAMLLFTLPAYAAEDTYCEHLGWAAIVADYLPQVGNILGILGIDTEQAIGFSTANIDNFTSGLRQAAMTKDQGELRRHLRMVGMEYLADQMNYSEIWTMCDKALPLSTAAAYRIQDGIPCGWLVRGAQWMYSKGYIDEMTPSAVLVGFTDVRLTETEEQAFIAIIAEEYAAAANLRVGE